MRARGGGREWILQIRVPARGFPRSAGSPPTPRRAQERIWEQKRKTVVMITHSIEEALLLSDRIVMMTRGPAARIDQVLEVPFSRPRNREEIEQLPIYHELKAEMEHHLFRETRAVEEARVLAK